MIHPKERALHYFDAENGDVRLTEGIALVKTDEIPVGRSLNEMQLPEEVEALCAMGQAGQSGGSDHLRSAKASTLSLSSLLANAAAALLAGNKTRSACVF